MKNTDIAIIGMSCRFPLSENIDSFWQNLIHGKELITNLNNYEAIKNNVNKILISNPNYINACGFIENIDKFDHDFFKISANEAKAMDPQQRLLLEESYHALENAGYNNKFSGTTGVFVGSGTPHYYYYLLKKGYLEDLSQSKHLVYTLGNEKDFFALKIAYHLNLTGPTLNINLSSATGLAVVIKACEALADGRADMMIAGASSLIMPNDFGYIYEKENILSPDGHCRPFDENSSGTVLSSGVGVVILKRLTDAIKDKDNIHAIIKGYSITNDGNNKIGFTAPSINAQSECIRKALDMVETNLNKIKYIEAHGTGTKLGDPIEIKALKNSFMDIFHHPKQCILGSVKANLGHAQAAAGMAGLIKLVLSIKNKKIPPLINFTAPNPNLNITNTPFCFNTEVVDWVDSIRLGGVNSLGMGGVNCHVIVENYPDLINIYNQSYYKFKKISHWALEANNIINENIENNNNSVENIAEKLTIIWKKCLNIDTDVFLYERFDQIGGTSLQAIEIITEINKEFNLCLNLDDWSKLLEFNSLIEYISIHKNTSTKESIIELTSTKSEKTLFLIHPGNGEIFYYRKLAEQLNSKINLICIQNSLFNDVILNDPSIKEIAARYMALIKTYQSNGPYYLGGWSLGGVISFEMAKQLLENDDQVDQVFLIDSWAKYGKKLYDINFFNQTYCRNGTSTWNRLLWQRMQQLSKYVPSKLNTPISLLKANICNEDYLEVNAFDNHWQQYCGKVLSIHQIPGSHETIMQYSESINTISNILIDKITNI